MALKAICADVKKDEGKGAEKDSGRFIYRK